MASRVESARAAGVDVAVVDEEVVARSHIKWELSDELGGRHGLRLTLQGSVESCERGHGRQRGIVSESLAVASDTSTESPGADSARIISFGVGHGLESPDSAPSCFAHPFARVSADNHHSDSASR